MAHQTLHMLCLRLQLVVFPVLKIFWPTRSSWSLTTSERSERKKKGGFKPHRQRQRSRTGLPRILVGYLQNTVKMSASGTPVTTFTTTVLPKSSSISHYINTKGTNMRTLLAFHNTLDQSTMSFWVTSCTHGQSMA